MTRWQPDSGVPAARTRATMLRRIRDHFAGADVLEVDTPTLSPYAVSDTQIESFEIQKSAVSPVPLFLSTSPEFCMKRLLAAGYPDIYSICRVFRDGESGARHQPEFTMIEWYRLGFDLNAIVADTIAVVNAALADDVHLREPVRLDYRNAFLEATGVDPFTAMPDDLATVAQADAELRQAVGDHTDDWLDLILATHVASSFASDRLTVLQHYPASQAALARLCPDDASRADRFEVFLGASELANGYVELTDVEEQARRMQHDDDERRRRDRPVRPRDRDLLGALRAGLPACAGVAMGFERLQMMRDGTDEIRDVLSFAFEARQ